MWWHMSLATWSRTIQVSQTIFILNQKISSRVLGLWFLQKSMISLSSMCTVLDISCKYIWKNAQGTFLCIDLKYFEFFGRFEQAAFGLSRELPFLKGFLAVQDLMVRLCKHWWIRQADWSIWKLTNCWPLKTGLVLYLLNVRKHLIK